MPIQAVVNIKETAIAGAFKAEIKKADVAQSVERVLGKDEVTGSIPVIGSSALH